MSHKVRIWIAATVTGLFLAGISLAGLAAHDGPRHPATPASQAATSAPAPAVGEDEREEETEHDE